VRQEFLDVTGQRVIVDTAHGLFAIGGLGVADLNREQCAALWPLMKQHAETGDVDPDSPRIPDGWQDQPAPPALPVTSAPCVLGTVTVRPAFYASEDDT
jgi:hypothetical protein